MATKDYSGPELSAEKSAAVAQGDFDFLMPFAKNLLRTDEVASVLNRDQSYVRALVESGRLEAHRDSAFGTRKSNLITRRSVILYLAETASYDTSFLVLRVETLLTKLDGPALDRIVAKASTLRNQIR